MPGSTFIKPLIGIITVAIIFYFLGTQTAQNWEAIKNHQWNLNIKFLLFSFILLLIFWFYRPFLWKQILSLTHESLNYSDSLWVVNISMLGRYIPGKIWLFLGKIYLCSNEGIPKLKSSVAVLTELILTLLSALFVSLFFASSFTNVPIIGNTYFFIPFIPLGLIILHKHVLNYLLKKISALTKKEITLLDYKYSKILIIFLQLSLMWIIYSIGNYYFYKSLVTVPFRGYDLFLYIIPLSWFAGYISFITPDGLGVRESITTFGFKSFLPFSVSSILSIALRLWITFIEILSIGITIILNRKKFLELFGTKKK